MNNRKNAECNDNKVELTIFLIAILILTRIFFNKTEQILYIVYIINIASVFIVIVPLFRNSYYEVSDGIEQSGLNNYMKDKIKKLKRKYIIKGATLFIVMSVLGIIIYINNAEMILSLLNDIIALVALGLSIEDKKIYEYLIKKAEY